MSIVTHRIVSTVAAAIACSALAAAKCYGQEPTAAEIFQRYVAAAGGEAALRAVQSRTLTGRVVTPGGEAPMVIVEAPNGFLRTIDSPASGHSENGYDGKVAWTKNDDGVREISGPQVGMMQRELHLYRPLALATFYRTVAPPRADTLRGRAVYALTATSADGITEVLYFDRATGLLAGWDVTIGDAQIANRLDDYREVDGMKVAFLIRRSRADFAWSEVFTAVQHNARVDTTRFAIPKDR